MKEISRKSSSRRVSRIPGKIRGGNDAPSVVIIITLNMQTRHCFAL
jgi:hypothetical protein